MSLLSRIDDWKRCSLFKWPQTRYSQLNLRWGIRARVRLTLTTDTTRYSKTPMRSRRQGGLCRVDAHGAMQKPLSHSPHSLDRGWPRAKQNILSEFNFVKGAIGYSYVVSGPHPTSENAFNNIARYKHPSAAENGVDLVLRLPKTILRSVRRIEGDIYI